MVAWLDNPLRELEALRREIDRAFSDAGYDRAAHPYSRVSFLPGRSARAYPLLNLSEDKDNLHVEGLAPGVNPATIEVTVVRDQLTVSGEKSALNGDIKPEAIHRNERAAGKFVRTVTLPCEVDEGRVRAEYKNGLLAITLPKAETAKPRKITVNAG